MCSSLSGLSPSQAVAADKHRKTRVNAKVTMIAIMAIIAEMTHVFVERAGSIEEGLA